MIVKWEVSQYSTVARHLQFDRETAAFWWNGQRRTSKISRYLRYFDSEQDALKWVADRKLEEKREKLCRKLYRHGPELLEALKLTSDCLSKCLTGGEVSAAMAGRALQVAGELIESLSE